VVEARRVVVFDAPEHPLAGVNRMRHVYAPGETSSDRLRSVFYLRNRSPPPELGKSPPGLG
jgi:hypothetical protein